MHLDPPQGAWPHDPSGFLRSLRDKADLVRQGHQAGRAAASGPLRAQGLLFSGMGFSGVTANLVKDAATRALDIPFTIVKHYQFPHHVRRDWLTLAISYSGETEETLAVVADARRSGVPITAFSQAGTRLAGLAGVNVPQPPGYQPRAALGHSWFSLLGYLEATGLLNQRVPVDACVAAIREVDHDCGPEVPEARNEAKQLARRLVERIPKIYATPSFYGVGLEFRGMLNENAKKIADVDLVPECNHNDLSGWGGDSANRRHFAVLALSHAGQNPQMRKRLDFMEARYREWGVPWTSKVFPPIHSFPAHVVEQCRAIQLLDYTSFYIAALKGEDPASIPEIQGLKEHLRGTGAFPGQP
ncbi:MAG TPA: SIS domain-containing protein [Candidatus Thermoplasmatota archaeon]|nr:SIS domain-containing protein [Candidatus Thermoplasmatota archaeon]